MNELDSKTLDKIMNLLPDDLDEGHLAAFLLTVVDAYADGPGNGLGLLMTASMTYGRARGVSAQNLAKIYRSAADFVEGEGRKGLKKPTTH